MNIKLPLFVVLTIFSSHLFCPYKRDLTLEDLLRLEFDRVESEDYLYLLQLCKGLKGKMPEAKRIELYNQALDFKGQAFDELRNLHAKFASVSAPAFSAVTQTQLFFQQQQLLDQSKAVTTQVDSFMAGTSEGEETDGHPTKRSRQVYKAGPGSAVSPGCGYLDVFDDLFRDGASR